MSGILAFLFLALMSVLAIWSQNHVLFMIVAGLAIMTGLYAPDIISGDYATTPLGISIGLTMIAYSLLCCGWAFRLMFWKEGA